MRKVLLILTLLFCSTLWGCVQDRYDATPSPTPENGDMTFTLNVRVAGASEPQSRALTPGQELDIKSLDVLVFEKSTDETTNTTTETFRYHSSADASSATLAANIDGVQILSFQVPLKATTPGMTDRLVLIANASEEVAAVVDTLETLTKYEDIIPQLTFATDAAWKTTGDKVRPLPMWGELSNQTVSEKTESFKDINLLRAVARIDLGYNIPQNHDESINSNDYNGPEGFEILQVHIVDVPATSRLVPASNNILEGKVTIPTLADSSKVSTHKYSGSVFYRDIYMGEAAAGSCKMLLQANFNGAPYWYGLEFIDQDKNQISILRNYRYRVNIKAINGQGYATAEEARNAPASNLLDYEVVEIDENYLGDIEYAEGYYLAVDRSEVELYTRGDLGHQIIVKTNYEEGFTIENPNDWFQVTPDLVNEAGEQVITVKYSGNGDVTGVSTPGSFTIRAGKITKEITVNLLDETLLTLSLSAEQLTFQKKPQASKTVTVTYSPSDAEFDWSMTQSTIDWRTSPTDGAKSGDGYVEIEMWPNDINNNELHSAQLVFNLTENGVDGTEAPKTITKKLIVIQYDGDVFFEVLNKDLTIDAGAVSHTFKIKSSDDWTLVGAAPAGDESEVQDIQLGAWDKNLQYGSTAYKDYKVTFAPNYTWQSRTWYFITESASGPWPEGVGEWPIEQKGTTPTLGITVNNQDFGAGPAAEPIEVTVKTDARWGFESQDGKAAWTNIAGVDKNYSYGYPGGDESENPDGHGADNCGFPQEYLLTFPGYSYDPAGTNPIPAVGQITVPVTFKTYTNEPTVKEVERTFEFTRTVPGFFRSVVDGEPEKLQTDITKLPREGGQVQVAFATNMDWEITTSNNVPSENSNGNAAVYDTLTQMVNITTPLWNPILPNGGPKTGTVTITARPKGEPTEGEPTELTAQIEQDMYYLKEARWANGTSADETVDITDKMVDTEGNPVTPDILIQGIYPALDLAYRTGNDIVVAETLEACNSDETVWQKGVTLPKVTEPLWDQDLYYDLILKTNAKPSYTLTRIGQVKVPSILTITDFYTLYENNPIWGNAVIFRATKTIESAEFPDTLSIKGAYPSSPKFFVNFRAEKISKYNITLDEGYKEDLVEWYVCPIPSPIRFNGKLEPVDVYWLRNNPTATTMNDPNIKAILKNYSLISCNPYFWERNSTGGRMGSLFYVSGLIEEDGMLYLAHVVREGKISLGTAGEITEPGWNEEKKRQTCQEILSANKFSPDGTIPIQGIKLEHINVIDPSTKTEQFWRNRYMNMGAEQDFPLSNWTLYFMSETGLPPISRWASDFPVVELPEKTKETMLYLMCQLDLKPAIKEKVQSIITEMENAE